MKASHCRCGAGRIEEYGKNVANSAADVKQAIDDMSADVVNFPQ
ncbi:hypothetical protein [Mixta calida]|nr:hypothetical protein [Mixta calida]